MACFLVPMTEAIVMTVVQKVVEKKEKKAGVETVTSADGYRMEKLPFSKKIGWLNKLLWGGSALLAFEHLLHRFRALSPCRHGDRNDSTSAQRKECSMPVE